MDVEYTNSAHRNLPIEYRYHFTFVALLLLVSHSAWALERVSVQLDWKFQFEFAGFIMAKEKGYYEHAGLDVELLEYQQVSTLLKRYSRGRITMAFTTPVS